MNLMHNYSLHWKYYEVRGFLGSFSFLANKKLFLGTWLEHTVEDLAQQTDALGKERRARESLRIKRNEKRNTTTTNNLKI